MFFYPNSHLPAFTNFSECDTHNLSLYRERRRFANLEKMRKRPFSRNLSKETGGNFAEIDKLMNMLLEQSNASPSRLESSRPRGLSNVQKVLFITHIRHNIVVFILSFQICVSF